ncbi:MAG: OmpH family outer membrane protein [Reichenbachiella sp.]|uniref:OmpH family outer membrane protein n=1 Tax=Reichenbachiella sp. TaxID=2184521 RepID=UPI0032651035
MLINQVREKYPKYLWWIAGMIVLLNITAWKLTDNAPQTRLAVVDTSLILNKLPEVNQASQALDTLKAQLAAQLQSKLDAYSLKQEELASNKDKLADLILKDKQAELQQMQKSIQEFQKAANDEFSKKESESLTPIWNNLQLTINNVAKEMGFTHVINSNNQQNPILLYSLESTVINDAVLVKLGLDISQSE